MAESIAHVRGGVPDPVSPEDVPRWLLAKWGVDLIIQPIRGPNRSNGRPGGIVAYRFSVPGIAEGLEAYARHRLDRGEERLRKEAIIEEAKGRLVAARRLRRDADRARQRSAAPPSKGDQKGALVQFVVEFRKTNRWVLSDMLPRPGYNLPFEAVPWIAWHVGVWLRIPTPNSVRALRRLLKRHE